LPFGIKSPTLLNDCAGSVNALSHTGNYLILANVLAKGLSALSGLESLPEPRLGLFQRISHAAVGNAVNGPAPVLPRYRWPASDSNGQRPCCRSGKQNRQVSAPRRRSLDFSEEKKLTIAALSQTVARAAHRANDAIVVIRRAILTP
jgi:hypothetical protein